MAVVIKTSTDVLYQKVSQITNSLKDIQQQLADINSLETDLYNKFWQGDASTYNVKEIIDAGNELEPILSMLYKRPEQLLRITDLYGKVEIYNTQAEAGSLPTDFLK